VGGEEVGELWKVLPVKLSQSQLRYRDFSVPIGRLRGELDQYQGKWLTVEIMQGRDLKALLAGKLPVFD